MKATHWLWSVVLLFVGCADGRHVDFARYDPNDDSFIHLHSWTNIPLEGRASVDGMQSTWGRRETLLIVPYAITTSPVIERKGGRSYQWGGLGSSTSEPAAEDPAINFDSIRIEPGVLYQDEQQRLGYFHSEVIPGETMTAIVAAGISALADSLADEHLGKARALNDRCASWADFRQAMNYHLDEMAEVKGMQKPQHDNGDIPFDVATLTMWQGAVNQRSFKVTRLRDDFVAIVPMSVDDVQESIATFQAYQDKLSQLVNDGRPIKPILTASEAFSMKAVDGPGLQITFQFSKLAKVWNELSKARLAEPLDVKESGKKKYEASIFAIQERGIPIAPRKSIDDLVAEFFR